MKIFHNNLLTMVLLFSVFIAGCGTSYEEPDTAIEAGRQFISAIYNGNFKRAGQLIEPGDSNRIILEERIEKDFRARDGFGKEALSKASIQILRIINADSTHTHLHFTNAYTGKDARLNITKVNGLWRVNLQNFSR